MNFPHDCSQFYYCSSLLRLESMNKVGAQLKLQEPVWLVNANCNNLISYIYKNLEFFHHFIYERREYSTVQRTSFEIP